MGKVVKIAPAVPLRPFPPKDMGRYIDGEMRPSFVPAKDALEWVLQTFIREDAKLYNPDHQHLEFVNLQFLWAAGGYEKQMRRIIGQTEEVAFRCGAWQKGRQEQQMVEWFGSVPDYLITLDAAYCENCNDIEFCALVEHELYHIGHKQEFGAPAYDRHGNPKIGIRDHDVSEFIGVVARYGVGQPEGQLAQMIEAAKGRPSVGIASIAQACGTCRLKVA